MEEGEFAEAREDMATLEAEYDEIADPKDTAPYDDDEEH